MKTRFILAAIAVAGLSLLESACGGDKADKSAGPREKVINSTKAGDLTVTLASATGELTEGQNQLTLSFADASGKAVDVGSVSLKFHMPAMGTMAEMNDVATVTTATAPGIYRASVNIEVGATWDAIISYQGPRGGGQATMSVTAK